MGDADCNINRYAVDWFCCNFFKEYFKDKLDIKAVAYTGSSGAFYYKLFTRPGTVENCADIVIDEITCHALGVLCQR